MNLVETKTFESILLELRKAAEVGDLEKVARLSEELKSFSGSQAQKAYIVNISDQEKYVSRSYYPIWVKPAIEEPYAVTEINSVVDQMDMGLGTTGDFDPRTGSRPRVKTIPVPFSAEQIANDVVKSLNSGLGEGAFIGVFVSLTPTPSKEELAEARKKYHAYLQKLIYDGNMLWSQKPDFRMISDAMRRAAKLLDEKVPWCQDIKDWGECPACKNRVQPGTAKCSHAGCGAILDIDKCLEYGIPVPEHMLERHTRPSGKQARA